MRSDSDLIQIVDWAMTQAAGKSGSWLLCRPGCTQCCYGPFDITQLDAARLRGGLAELQSRDPVRAAAIRDRARLAVRVAGLGEDDPCPVLDPTTGTCELYAARPITCRCFGPPVHCDSRTIGVCELCYKGATDEEIAACLVEVDPDGLESTLIEALEKATGVQGMTTVAQSLAS